MEGVEDENKKKKDGRANNGALKGIYRGQGRPPKAREKKVYPAGENESLLNYTGCTQ